MIDDDTLKTLLRSLPHEPGVYIMKNEAGTVIYIGKASSIKKRVASYFRRAEQDPKTESLVRAIADIEYIVTDNEMEALILESSLVKENMPRYNVRLKDDKRYPSIAVTLDEAYPRVIVTRDLRNPGNRYFGPYTDAKAARRMAATINRVFKLKTCTKILPLKKNERPCLNYQMKRCQGVCTGEMTRDEYLGLIDGAMKFLGGSIDPVLNNLQDLMRRQSETMKFEKAARIRDIIFDIQKLSLSQKVYTAEQADHDYIALSLQESESILLLFEFRRGMMLGSKISVFDIAEISEKDEILRSFILNYYSSNEAPQRIILETPLRDKSALEDILAGRWSKKISLLGGDSPEDRSIFSLMQKNIENIIISRGKVGEDEETRNGLMDLQQRLGLDVPPSTIECFDISHFHGDEAVASMVFFRGGKPEKSNYRRYKIRGYDGVNDPGMIHEVVSRRIQFLLNEDHDLPDLMIVDGGPAQLGRAREAVDALGLDIAVIAIAKKHEEIYRGETDDPLRIPEGSMALKIIQRARDEAHRFAVTYHRSLRDKKQKKSALDDIPGVSDVIKKTLLSRFGSIDAIRSAGIDELCAAPGIGEKTAKKISDFFLSKK